MAIIGLGLSGCGAGDDLASGFGGEEAETVGENQEPITTWTNLILRNGWKAAANSPTPAVGIVNGIVTFRGALNGQQATSGIPFCLGTAAFANYRIADVGVLPLRVALATGGVGSLTIDIPLNPNTPAEDRYCARIHQYGSAAQPGLNAKNRTSLDGVSYDRRLNDSVHMDYNEGWGSPYPWRGSDGNAHPEGQGGYAKLVNGFVRFQGAVAGNGLSPPTLFKLPSGQGMRPGNTVYLPVTLCGGLGGSGRIAVRTNGNVDVLDINDDSRCAVHLDGVSFSMSSPASAKPITLLHNWVAHSSRAVRARNDNGVIRLEGAVKNGNITTIGTLPAGMWPAKSVTLVASATASAAAVQLSIGTSGTIMVVWPQLDSVKSGISFDGVSFHL